MLVSTCGRAWQVDPAPKEPKAHPRLCHQVVAQLAQSTIPRRPRLSHDELPGAQLRPGNRPIARPAGQDVVDETRLPLGHAGDLRQLGAVKHVVERQVVVQGRQVVQVALLSAVDGQRLHAHPCFSAQPAALGASFYRLSDSLQAELQHAQQCFLVACFRPRRQACKPCMVPHVMNAITEAPQSHHRLQRAVQSVDNLGVLLGPRPAASRKPP
jgi:hypothetical protein